MRIKRRTRAIIQRMLSKGVVPKRSRTRPSFAARLPQEIVEIIIGQLRYDIYSLLACCLTCYSWYIAAVPHLHNTLVTPTYVVPGNEKPWWPDSFRSMCKLGLFPLVKKLQMRELDVDPTFGPARFSPKLFDRRILRQFSALTNVRELGIDYLDIPSFMPKI